MIQAPGADVLGIGGISRSRRGQVAVSADRRQQPSPHGTRPFCSGSNPVGATGKRAGQREGKKEGACDDDPRVENVFKPSGLEDSRKLFRDNGSLPGCQFNSLKQSTDWEYSANTKLHSLEIKNSAGEAIESHQLSYENAAEDYLNGHRVTDDFGLKGPEWPAASDSFGWASSPDRGIDSLGVCTFLLAWWAEACERSAATRWTRGITVQAWACG
jgi:hypothetical protein